MVSGSHSRLSPSGACGDRGSGFSRVGRHDARTVTSGTARRPVRRRGRCGSVQFCRWSEAGRGGRVRVECRADRSCRATRMKGRRRRCPRGRARRSCSHRRTLLSPAAGRLLRSQLVRRRASRRGGAKVSSIAVEGIRLRAAADRPSCGSPRPAMNSDARRGAKPGARHFHRTREAVAHASHLRVALSARTWW